jgi:hypothetical protein
MENQLSRTLPHCDSVEHRHHEKPIPDDLESMLSTFQVMALHRLESFGWELLFVRREVFHAPIPIVFSDAGNKVGVLEEDGHINLDLNIKIRA